MAPEMLRGEQPGPPSDLFSLGCVLYEALAGRPPFEGADALAVLYRIAHEEPPPLRQARPDAPADLVGVVEGLLLKDAERRFGPASAVALALAGEPTTESIRVPLAPSPDETVLIPAGSVGATGARMDPKSAVASTPGTPARRLRRPRHPRALGVVIVLLAVGGVLVSRSGGPRPGAAPERAAAQLDEATTLEESGRFDAAEAAYRRAISADSTLVAPRVNLAQLLLHRGRPLEAVEVLRDATRRWPGVAVLWRDLGLAYVAVGDDGGAGEALGTALALAPNDPSVSAAMNEWRASIHARSEPGARVQPPVLLDSAAMTDLQKIPGLRDSVLSATLQELQRQLGAIPGKHPETLPSHPGRPPAPPSPPKP
jgi:tetratricopeptide (TPR) repeat protein